MLGEAALTDDDANRYLKSYLDAVEEIGEQVNPNHSTYQKAGISVKLSALHPRYEEADHEERREGDQKHGERQRGVPANGSVEQAGLRCWSLVGLWREQSCRSCGGLGRRCARRPRWSQ